MAKKVSKTVVIGLDAPVIKSIWKYVQEGKLPNMGKLIEQGVWAENCLVPHPTITPPNWTTIVTGAWPGTHGITCFHVHKPGEPLDRFYQAFLTTDCEAEYIWDAAERVGKKSIILNYPTSWPPTIKEGIQIGGAGLSVNDWRVSYSNEPLYRYLVDYSVSADQLFALEEYPEGNVIELQVASGWQNVPAGAKSLEAPIRLGYRRTRDKVKAKEWYLLVQDSEGKGYDKVILSKSKDGKAAIANLGVGEWSGKVVDEFDTDKGKKKGAFCCKLLELTRDASRLKLYFTPICQLAGWAFPEGIAGELEGLDGLPLPFQGAFEAFLFEWIDVETLMEVADFEHIWLGEVANYLLKNKDWSVFFMQAHCPDFAYHAFINKLEPLVCKDEKELSRYQAVECSFYESLDRLIGRIVEATDEETLVIITSDHGAVPTEGGFESDFRGFDAGQILAEAGLTVYKKVDDNWVIDWSKTKAVVQRSIYVYVNLKGRDPQGIVEPGEEYEQVREQIIKALYDYTDPKTGKKPITLALRKEDARMLGLYGDRVGDVVYGVKAEFSGEHGRQLPTAEYGMGSMRGLLIMCGPNIKKNYILRRTTWLTDITPTICYLMDIPMPKDAEGAIIYQAMVDPDIKLHELETCRKNYGRLKKAYEGESALTHRYR